MSSEIGRRGFSGIECSVSCSPFRSAAILLLSLVSVITLVSCSSSLPAAIAITHVTVIDATGAAPQPDSNVILAGSRILAVGPSVSTAIPRGAKTIDGSGKFLIPGLADMHLHLTGAGEPSGSREFIFPLLVANGIATVRDMGGNVEYLKELRAEIDSGKRVGPQIYFTGPYLDGNPPSFQPSIVVQNAAEAAAAVRKLKGEGVDFIKVQSRLQPEAYYAIARESLKRNIRFVGHVPDSITAAAASDAGQASIEHLTGVLLGCSTREEELGQRQLQRPPPGETPRQRLARIRASQRDLLDSYSQEQASRLFQKFAANRTWQVPTFPLLIYDSMGIPLAFGRMQNPMTKYLPKNLRQSWEQGRSEGLGGGVNSTNIPDYYKGFFELQNLLEQKEYEIVRGMNAAGVPIMAGTDATAPMIFPGFSLHEDLAYLVKAGLTPMQALQAATSKPAEFLGRSAEQGTIEAGKRADLVLLEANPLEDIRNTQTIAAVFINGKFLSRGDLDGLLASVERFAASH